MSAPTDQFIEIANRTQEAVTTAVRTWADTVQTFTGSVTGSRPSLPNAQGAVDRYFDFAEQILESQRRIAKTVLTASAQAAETVTEQAARTAETVAAAHRQRHRDRGQQGCRRQQDRRRADQHHGSRRPERRRQVS